MLPHINEYKHGNYGDEALWNAFFQYRIVYLRSGFVYELPLAIAAEQKITSMFLLNPARKPDIQVKVADALREKDWLGAPIDQGYFGRHYDITYGEATKPRYKAYLMPIRYEAFGVDLNVLQRKRTGYARLNRSIISRRLQTVIGCREAKVDLRKTHADLRPHKNRMKKLDRT